MRRGSFELSAEMMVVLIISLVVLSMGIILVKKIYSRAEADTARLSEQTERQIWELMDEGGRVVNPFNRQETNRARLATFGIGVRNVIDDPETFAYNSDFFSGGNRFRVRITPSLAAGSYPLAGMQQWILVSNTAVWIPPPPPKDLIDYYIRNNERQVFAVGIAVPRDAELGTYAFNLEVQYLNSTHPLAFHQYAPTEKLYVVVK